MRGSVRCGSAIRALEMDDAAELRGRDQVGGYVLCGGRLAPLASLPWCDGELLLYILLIDKPRRVG